MLYGVGNSTYTLSGSAANLGGVYVSIQGNTSGAYTTTAYLRIVNLNNGTYTSASSTGDVVTVKAPLGYKAYVSAKSPDYWSASTFDTNLTNYNQVVPGSDTHSLSGTARLTADAYFTLHNSAVGYRYFSALACDGGGIFNGSGDDSMEYGNTLPYNILSSTFSGDTSILSSVYMQYRRKVIKTATQEISSYTSNTSVTSFRPDITLKNIYMEVGDQSAYAPPPSGGLLPMEYSMPYYVFRSMDLTGNRGKLSISFRLAGKGSWTELYDFTNETATSFPALYIASASASSYTINSAVTNINYFGNDMEITAGEWTRYCYIDALTMGSSIALYYSSMMPTLYRIEPNIFISGISQ